MKQTIKYLKIPSVTNDRIKLIEFYKNGKENKKQIAYFNQLFDINGKIITNERELAYWGSFRCGKSFTQQLAMFLICIAYSGVNAIYIRDTYAQLEDSVIKQFHEEFEWLGYYKYNVADRICKFQTGSELRFRTFERDSGILSTEYDVIGICQTEDIKIDLFLQLLGRLSGKILPHPLLLTEGNPTSGFYKERYKDNPDSHKDLGIYFIEGQIDDNPFITSEYKQNLIKNYPVNWIARYVYGQWSQIDEMVFSEFREVLHVIDPIDFKYTEKFRHRGGFDYAWRTNSAMNWAYLDYDGNVTIYDEWFKKEALPDEIIRASSKYNSKDKKTLFVADYSIKKPDHYGRNLWDDLSPGMNLVECSKDELNNILLVNSLIKQGKWKITRNCTNTIKEMLNWKWKQVKLGTNKDIPDETEDKDNHNCDCVLYIVSDLCGKKTQDPKELEYKKTLEYAVKFGTDNQSWRKFS
jgi:PBSX family phage terminase large subunit